jgi:hypothetical protein
MAAKKRKQAVPENTSSVVTPIFQDVDVVAERLQVSPRYVHTLMQRRRDPLPSVKLGRRRLIPVLACERWAAAQAERKGRAA